MSDTRATAAIRRFTLATLVAAASTSACDLAPQRIARNDPSLKPMFDAIARVDRTAMGFTPIAADAELRLESVNRRLESVMGVRPKIYDAMLHVFGKTYRTVAFKRTTDGYEWIGEQETFEGPREYRTPDGTFR